MLDKARQRVGGPAAALVVVLLALSVFLLVSGYVAEPLAFHSDNLLSTAQCDDVLHGRDLTDWHLPGAPYVFPDLLLLAPCQALAPTAPVAFLAYCLLLHLGIAAVLAWLGRLSGLGRRAAVLAAGCGATLLVVMNLGGHDSSNRCWLLVHPGSHVGAILVGLFLLAWTIHSLRRGPSWRSAVVFLLVGGLGAFSDNLLVAQFLAPLGVALMVLAVRRVVPFRQAAGQLALVGASFALALAIKVVFRRLGFHLLEVDTSFHKPRLPDLVFMLRRLYQEVAGDHLLLSLIPLHLLMAVLVVRVWSRRPEETSDGADPNRRAVLLAALTAALSPGCILAALFVAGMSRHEAVPRYTLSCWFLPPLLLPLLAHWLPGRLAGAGRAALQLGIVLFALVRAAELLPKVEGSRYEDPYPPLARELDRLVRERGPMCGLAGFWSSRSTSWFTREHVPVNTLSAMGEPWFHASNPARFLPGDELRMPDYRFLIVRPGEPFTPSPAVLALHFGAPAEKVQVGPAEIWLYDAPLRSPPFDRFLRSRLADRLRRKRPFTGPAEPACLARPKANMTPADAPGNVALGDGQSLEIHFSRPTTGRLLDVGANDDNRLDVDFFRGDERLGSLAVPAVPWTGASYEKPGIQSRLLPLPPALRERPWDRLVVRPRPGLQPVRLAHVLVFDDDVPGLEEERPVPVPRRLRMEAESLLPINPGTPYTDDPDPSASGGLARRAAVDFACAFSHTPRLFLPRGRYRLECALKADDNRNAEEVASLCVAHAGSTSPVERPVRGTDFPAAGRYATHALTFEVEEDDGVVVGVRTAGKTPLTLDYMDLISEPPASPGERP